MVKSISKDPFDIANVSRACGKEPTYFSVTIEERTIKESEEKKLFYVLNTANKDQIYETTSAKAIRTYLEGIHKGCLIGRGIEESARQRTLFGEETKAPRELKSAKGILEFLQKK